MCVVYCELHGYVVWALYTTELLEGINAVHALLHVHVCVDSVRCMKVSGFCG